MDRTGEPSWVVLLLLTCSKCEGGLNFFHHVVASLHKVSSQHHASHKAPEEKRRDMVGQAFRQNDMPFKLSVTSQDETADAIMQFCPFFCNPRHDQLILINNDE